MVSNETGVGTAKSTNVIVARFKKCRPRR